MSYGAYIKAIFLDMPAAARIVSILGGGALRSFYDGTPAKDYDLFFRSYQDYLIAFAAFSQQGNRYKELAAPNGTSQFHDLSTGRLFNLVGFHFDTPQGHRDAFDFRCCMFVAWLEFDLPTASAHPNAAADAEAKRLVVMNNNGDERTYARMHRYRDYGYRLELGFDEALSEQTDDVPLPSFERVKQLLKSHPKAARGVGSDGLASL
ncbi:hypothetical protein [Xanthomonas cannabis]|uniref:hypothetical protein n=1 Tax=Xanthomonas cannabis TaxID=1885674 RepID=UPI00141A8928|nr:hypothetical protein [Xanthomonas cannabis]NIK19485.1 hypothetical protein [Xanthomonas cannabis]